jgi:hypothetical protein
MVIFYDRDHSQAVPTPQFNVAQHLDQSYALTSTLSEFERNAWSSAESGYDAHSLRPGGSTA